MFGFMDLNLSQLTLIDAFRFRASNVRLTLVFCIFKAKKIITTWVRS